VWYAPGVPHVLEQQGLAWILPSDHRLFGGDVLDWQVAIEDANRLWLTVMPGYNGPEQEAVYETIESTYPRLMTEDWGPVQLYLYDLQGAK
jgi:hypothetical protein